MPDKGFVEEFIAQQSLGGTIARLLRISEPCDFGDCTFIGPWPSIGRGPFADGLAIRVGKNDLFDRNATSRSELLLLGVYQSLLVLLVEFHGLPNLETVHKSRCIRLTGGTCADFGIGNLANDPNGPDGRIMNMSTNGKKSFLVGELIVLGLVRNVLQKFFEDFHLMNTD